MASGGHSSSRCAGLSLSWPLLLRSTGSRSAGSVIVAHRPSCSVACGIFPDQGSNSCSLHWQADSQPLRHQGSPVYFFFNIYLFIWLHRVLFIYLFLYLFLAVLGLRFCVRAFSICGKRGPLIIAVRGPLHYRGLSCCGAQAPDAQAQ